MTRTRKLIASAAAPLALALLTAAAPVSAQAQEDRANPMPDINLALVYDGREVAADTTDEMGFAEFPAAGLGDHGVTLQEPVPVNAALSVLVGEEEFSVLLSKGLGPQPAIEIPVEHVDDIVMVRLEAMDPDWRPVEQGAEHIIGQPEAPIDVPTHGEVTRANAPDADNLPPEID